MEANIIQESDVTGQHMRLAVKLTALVWMVSCCHLAGAQPISIELRNHPNRYIILLDGTGSTVSTPVKTRLYFHLVREVLPERLFQGGMGTIPPYDPQQDTVTIFLFGLLDKGSGPVTYELASQDFLTDYIHPIVSDRKNVSEIELRNISWPKVYYRYTMMAWSRQLGLWTALTSKSGPYNRTFLILATDGIPNEGTEEEIRHVRLFGGPKAQDASKIVNRIDAAYRFMNGHGDQPYLERVGHGEQSFFLEASEVFPSSYLEWQHWADGVTALLPSRWSLSDRLQHWQSAEVTASWSTDFSSRLRSAETTAVTLSDPRGSLQVPVSLSSSPFSVFIPSGCGIQSTPIRFSTEIHLHDELMTGILADLVGEENLPVTASLRCAIPGWLLLAACLVSLAVLIAATIYWLRLRFFTTHIFVRIPGQTVLRLRRSGQTASFAANLSPLPGETVAEVLLPNSFCRLVFYRGATLSLVNGDIAQQIDLRRHKDRRIEFVWPRVSTTSVLQITFTQQNQSAIVEIEFWRNAGMRAEIPSTKDISPSSQKRCYVALDLGSESMAAYYALHPKPEEKIVALQTYGRALIGKEPDYLRDDGRISARLRTRLGLKSGISDDIQATLSFVNQGSVSTRDYERSHFQFFAGPRERQTWKLLPNPKIMFQRGAKNILPSVSHEGQSIPTRDEPKSLIQWLTVQVLSNFVLGSEELHSWNGEVHVILTVPNIYSVTHVENLRRFVQETLKDRVQSVEAIYESDAVAWFPFGQWATGDIDHGFAAEVDRVMRVERGADVLTIDMGRGTTDLSYVRFELSHEVPEDGRKRAAIRHSQKARTGRSDGGAKLTHILVEFFEGALQAAFTRAGASLPFGFLTMATTAEQAPVIESLEAYVEALKRAVDEHYLIQDSPELRKLRDELVENVASAVSKTVSPGLSEADADAQLPTLLRGAFTLPSLATSGKTLIGKVKHWFQSNDASNDRFKHSKNSLLSLRNKLDQYVSDNVDELIDDLAEMKCDYEKTRVAAASGSEGRVATEYVNKPDTQFRSAFAIIAGRGSYFAPVNRAIREALNAHGIRDGRVLSLPPTVAKECCCRGAVAFYTNRVVSQSIHRLHGTYLLLPKVFGLQPIPIDTSQLERDGKWADILDTQVMYSLVFSPKPLARINLREINFNSGELAVLQDVLGGNGSQVELKYDQATRQLLLNDVVVELQPYPTAPEEIYASIWPEVLRPQTEIATAGTVAGAA
jgi:hypothetical protein